MKNLRQWSLRPILLTLFMPLGLVLLHSPFVVATDLPPFGNSGGNTFRAECPKGSYLVGLQGKAGECMDRIATLCAPWLHATQTFGSASVGPSLGDSRGGNVTFGNCNGGNVKNQAVQSWSLTLLRGNNPFVNKVTAQCIALGTPASPSNFVFGSSSAPSGSLLRDPTVGPWKQTCPGGEVAAGIQGRAGLFLDAVGLICGPFPPPKPPIAATKVNPFAIRPRGVEKEGGKERNETVEQPAEMDKKP